MICKTVSTLILIVFFVPRISTAQTELFVSLKGNDKNLGTKEKPFASLAQAQLAARKLNGSITVYLRGGTYYLHQPIIFVPADSRKEGEEIIYKSFGTEKVTISGAVPLKLQWQDFTGGIKKASLSKDIVFDQFFINGIKQPMARYPNYNSSVRHFGGVSADALSTERTKKWKDPTGGFVHALHKHEWGDFHYVITGKDEKGGLTLAGGFQNNRKMGMHKYYRFVENVFEELDTLNEWYYNKAQHTLYFYPPPGLNLATSIVEIPQLNHLFEFRGSEARPIKGITLEGFQLMHTLHTFMENKEPLLRSDWTIYRGGAVVLEGAEHCKIKKCYFNTVGSNAIFFSNYNRNHEVSGCEIVGAGASAICFVGDPLAVRSPSFEYNEFVAVALMDKTPGPKSNNYPANCLVYDNLIHDIGQVEKQITGVEISMAQSITVSHNTIYNTPRAGINISEGTWGGHILEYNDVFNTVLETGDHGSFNSWGRDRYWHPNYDTLQNIVAKHPELILLDVVKPIVIRNNRFRCDHGWDIDLDDGSSNYYIYNNLCLNGGLKLREGFKRIVENNIMVNNSFHPHVWFKNSGDVFTKNIITRPYYPINLKGWGTLVDFNLFPDSISLIKAQKRGTDSNSVYGDPQFKNPSSGDFSVAENSPALKLGFKNFPMDSFGVISPALKKRAMKITIPNVIEGSKAQDVKYEWMAMSIKNLNTLGERSATGMASERGVYVVDIMTWSQFSGKLKPNDVILSYNKKTVNTVLDLEKSHLSVLPNTNVEIIVFRNQKELLIEVQIR